MKIKLWWNTATPEDCFRLTYFGYLVPLLDHLSQVNDEAVSLVEAIPGQVHLCGSDHTPTFNMQQALDLYFVAHHMLEAWGYSTFLWQE